MVAPLGEFARLFLRAYKAVKYNTLQLLVLPQNLHHLALRPYAMNDYGTVLGEGKLPCERINLNAPINPASLVQTDLSECHAVGVGESLLQPTKQSGVVGGCIPRMDARREGRKGYCGLLAEPEIDHSLPINRGVVGVYVDEICHTDHKDNSLCGKNEGKI